ncbi:MAG: ATP-binding protein [Burkholderiales bacterium]|nr:ATP-binding protein [Burkholderiales bacterium]
MSALPDILGCVRAACRDAGMIAPAALRVELVIEELFTNTVVHGYRGECDHPVWLYALPAPGALWLTYQDAASAFDPLAPDRPPEPQTPREVGGQGIPLIRNLATSVAYRRADDRNILTLLFAVTPR